MANNKSVFRCSVCGSESIFVGSKDANYSCNDHFSGRSQFPVAGQLIDYFSCVHCGFLFSPNFDGWTTKDFSERIYNKDYIKTDPPFLYKRPTRNAEIISSVMQKINDSLLLHDFDLLDYGSGSGVFERVMKTFGFNVLTCDPYYGKPVDTNKKFDVITAFEVVEHVARHEQQSLFATLSGMLKDEGVLIFSTQILDNARVKNIVDWWYVAPRNGHISIYSKNSLERIAAEFGLKCYSFNEGVHIMFKEPSKISNRMMLGDISLNMDILVETF